MILLTFSDYGTPHWTAVRRGATGGRWAARRGVEQPGTGGRAREKLPPRLVLSAAGPWNCQLAGKGQLAGNSGTAFLGCQPNQPQLALVANQAGLALKVQPDHRKEASGEEERVSCGGGTGVRERGIFYIFLNPYQTDHTEEEYGESSSQERGGGLKRVKKSGAEDVPPRRSAVRTKPWWSNGWGSVFSPLQPGFDSRLGTHWVPRRLCVQRLGIRAYIYVLPVFPPP